MRNWGKRAGAAALALSALAGCAPVTTDVAVMAAAGTREAVTWVEDFLVAGRESPAALAPYLAPDVVFDHRAVDSGRVQGRSEYLRVHWDWGYPGASTTGEVFLDADSAAVLQRVDGTDLLTHLQVGPAGLTVRRDLVDADAVGEATATPRRSVPDGSAVYVFRENDRVAPVTEMWVLTSPDDGCRQVQALAVDEDGRLTPTRRLVESSCPAGGRGWWTGLRSPTPLAQRVTGEVQTPTGTVEVANGSPALEAALGAALDLFADLGTPEVSSVTFDPYDPFCRRYAGRFSEVDSSLLLCFDQDTLCRDGTCALDGRDLEVVVHELGHVWVHGHTDAATRQALMDLVGVERWNDPDDRWHERGTEWAAETLTWGMLGGEQELVCMARPSCDLLVRAYTLLTGAAPAVSCSD
jgi:hypothetical protein